MRTPNAAQRLADRRVFGVERMAGHATGAGNGRDAAAQGRHGVAFAGGGKIGADDLGGGGHCLKTVLAAPGHEVGEVSGVRPQRRWRVGGVLVSLGLRQSHGGTRGRRLGAVQASHLAFAGFGERNCHARTGDWIVVNQESRLSDRTNQ
jgi:hypothetical protein